MQLLLSNSKASILIELKFYTRTKLAQLTEVRLIITSPREEHYATLSCSLHSLPYQTHSALRFALLIFILKNERGKSKILPKTADS